MIIAPYSSFNSTADGDLTNFPSAIMHFHMDDFTPSGGLVSTWGCQKTNVMLTFTSVTEPMQKFADGVYCDEAPTITVSGTMPTITNANYVALLGIGKTTTGNTVNGCNFTAGDSVASRLSLATAGTCTFNTVTQSGAQTLAPTALTNTAKPVAVLSYFDFVDVTGAPVNPRIDRVVCNTDFSAAVSMAFSTGGTTSAGPGNALTPGQLANAWSVASLGTALGERQVSMSVFAFANPVTTAELKTACLEAARTRHLPAVFRNRV